jgi:hypothetical protein
VALHVLKICGILKHWSEKYRTRIKNQGMAVLSSAFMHPVLNTVEATKYHAQYVVIFGDETTGKLPGRYSQTLIPQLETPLRMSE